MRQAKILYKDEEATVLTQHDDGSFTFRYHDAWMADNNKPGICLTMPKIEQEFHSKFLFPFFYAMLPEGSNKQVVCKLNRIDPSDYFGLLMNTAKDDSIGAVRVIKTRSDEFAGRTPQTHGTHYKYLGNYSEFFQLMQTNLSAYKVEAPKLLKILLFNYLFSNGEAHFKNFSLPETPMGDYRLSPAYDLLNSRIHVDDKDFALDDGLLPRNLAQEKISIQFARLDGKAGISEKIFNTMMTLMASKSDSVAKMVAASFLNATTKRNYWQLYQGRLKQLTKV